MGKSRNKKDPHAKREAQKYADPIPSREFILEHLEQATVPMDYQSLCGALNLQSEQQQDALRRRLRAMERDGQLISNRRGVYGVPDRMDLVKGRVQGSKSEYGFLIPADGSDDMYLSAGEMQKVFDGDSVLARCIGVDRRGRKEGMIVEVLQRRSNQIVGRYYSDDGYGILVPANVRINHEILIPTGQNHGAEDGQYVVGEITTLPSPRHKPVAKVVEILGDSTTPGLEIELAVRTYELPHIWPASVEKQAAAISTSIPARELEYRTDLRHLPFVTIDGEDAKDFDDAVVAQPRRGGGWTLYVAIADVSHYVLPASALDDEARTRGTSVYFPGHVIPMLPEVLSNGVCSLRPDEDRLVMVCEMTITEDGEVSGFRFQESVIHSHARLTYTEVSDLLEPAATDSGEKLRLRMVQRYGELIPHLESLYQLYQQLKAAREQRGALDFDTTETRIVFGEDRRIKEILPVTRNCAHRLIEECMLRANVAAAQLFEAVQLPALYRVHDGPSEEKLQNLRDYLGGLGLTLGGADNPEPRDYQRLLRRIGSRADAHLLHSMVIRSMMQAIYQAENIGHFGLGYEAYTHFTSPIRRYPDLLVHRAIRYLLRSKKHNRHLLKTSAAPALEKNHVYPYGLNEIQSLGEHCSVTERRADSASYDVVNWLKCEFMLDHIGEEYNGAVATVTGFGLFVELESIYIEGLVHITALANDYYHFDPASQILTGERSGRCYKMGDMVRVKVAAVNLDERKVDLVMVDGELQSDRLERGARHTKGSKNAKSRKSGAASKTMSRRDKKSGSKPKAQAVTASAKEGGKKNRKKSKRKASSARGRGGK